MTINTSTGAITSIGNDIYICSTAPSHDIEYSFLDWDFSTIGDKEKSVKFENGLVADHGFDIYIKNNENGVYNYGHYRNGYRKLNIEYLKTEYAKKLKELGYSSLAAALNEADATKQQANRKALGAIGMSDGAWVYTLDRPTEFSILKDTGDDYNYGRDYAQGNGQNNALIALLNGTSYDKFLGGTSANEYIYSSNDSNDVIRAGAGDDVIYGGQGDDQIWAGEGNNRIIFCNKFVLQSGSYSNWSGNPPYGYFYNLTEDLASNPYQQYNYDTQQYEWVNPLMGDGNDIVYNDGGVNTLDFAENNMVKFAKSGKDLVISYAFNKLDDEDLCSTVTVKDYFLDNGSIDTNHSAKYIKFKNRGTVLLSNEYNDYVEGTKYAWGDAENNALSSQGGVKEFLYGGADNDSLSGGKYMDGGVGNDYYYASASDDLVIISDSGYGGSETNYICVEGNHDGTTFQGFCDVVATKSGNNVDTSYGNSLYIFDGDFSLEKGIRVDYSFPHLLNENFDLSSFEDQGITEAYININESTPYNSTYKVRVTDAESVNRYTYISNIMQQTISWLSNNYDACEAVLGEGNVSTYNLMISTADGAAALQTDMLSSINSGLRNSYYGWSTSAYYVSNLGNY